jgi:hypothetical protein
MAVALPVEKKLLNAIEKEDYDAAWKFAHDPDLNINFIVGENNLTFPMEVMKSAIETEDLSIIVIVFKTFGIDFAATDNDDNTIETCAANSGNAGIMQIMEYATLPTKQKLLTAIKEENREVLLYFVKDPNLNINFLVGNLTFPMWTITTQDPEVVQAVFSRKDIDYFTFKDNESGLTLWIILQVNTVLRR